LIRIPGSYKDTVIWLVLEVFIDVVNYYDFREGPADSREIFDEVFAVWESVLAVETVGDDVVYV